MSPYHFKLNGNISVDVEHYAPLAVGSTIFRAIYAIRETPTGNLFKHYEVWLSQEYVEDRMRLATQATQDHILEFANNYLQERYKNSNNSIPQEDGAFLTNELGESLGNPRTFPLKLKDQDRPKYVTTTIRLPEETHKWLAEYGDNQKVGLGEAIRRVVGNYAAGTATIGDSEEQGDNQ